MNDRVERKTESGSGSRPYQKPRLRRIKLEAGEVLAKGCKLDGSNNFGNPAGCTLNNCVGSGS